jgi:hypothetical protein
MPFDFLTKEKFSAIPSFALAKPPTWTRLEPQSTLGDPRPGIEARVHDPLWMLGRQWQLGEFEGEDAGTPLTVRVVTRTTAIDRWAPGSEAEGRPLSSASHELLEPLIEREPVEVSSPGLRPRAEAAAALLAALDEARLGAHNATIMARCPLDLNPLSHPGGAAASLDPQWLRLVRLLGDATMADAETFCKAIEAAGGLPGWLVPASAAEGGALLAIIRDWMGWYRTEVSPLPGGDDDCWIGERLEYRFRIGASATVLAAPSHGGDAIDWHTFDPAPAAALSEPDGAAAPQETREVHAVLASPLRYAGMPADRLWEMEDARVNLGVVEAEPWDLARLLLAEFALTYGNDWLVVPVDVPFGSLTTIESAIYTTTFGEHFVVRPTAEVSPDGRWRMFAIADRTGAAVDGLLIPPGPVAVQYGPAVEEVLFLRDEMANMVWAVERAVQGPSGGARDRARERDDQPPAGPGPVESAQLDYRLQVGVPGRWIPFLPRSSGYRSIDLVQGRMSRPDGSAIVPLGRILNRPDVKTLKDAEVPREGVLVRRQFSMTRRADGSYVRWTTRRVDVGRGEGASQLAFDSAISRKPRPNS